MAYDAASRTTRFYVNGQPAGTTTYQTAGPVRIGAARIGAWSGEDRQLLGYLSYLYLFPLTVDAVAVGRLANWLVNPGAEAQPVTTGGWKQVSGDWSKLKSGTAANTGQAFFWGGVSPRAELAQEASLASLSSWLSDGGGVAELRFYLGSFRDDADSSQVHLEALGSNGSVLAAVTTGAKNYDAWTLESLRLALPPASS